MHWLLDCLTGALIVSFATNNTETHARALHGATLSTVCWRFLGDFAFPKKLSPQQIPASVDLEDSIVEMNRALGGNEAIHWLPGYP